MQTPDIVYSRIGMALVSGQRVEFITGELLKHLLVFDKNVYGITTELFLSHSPPAQRLRRQTLGQLFKLLKLNPKLIIADELDEYLKRRNILTHSFWKDYLFAGSEEQTKKVIDFCCEFGKASAELESYFKGFLYFIALRHVEDRSDLGPEFKGWERDFDYFLSRLVKQ